MGILKKKKKKKSYLFLTFFAKKARTEEKAPVFLSYPGAVCPAEAASGAGTEHTKSFIYPKLGVRPPFPPHLRQIWVHRAPNNFSRCCLSWGRLLCPEMLLGNVSIAPRKD